MTMNAPQLRFKIKNGKDYPEWSAAKLSEVATYGKGIGFSKSDLDDSGYPIILYGQMYTNYKTEINNAITFTYKNKEGVISCGNEVIIPASGETAEDISIASAIKKQGILIGGDINILYPCKKIDPVFLAYSITFGRLHKELSKKAQGKSIVHLHRKDIEEAVLLFPCLDEQHKLVSFFCQIDHLIENLERQICSLGVIKKCFLQKIFSQEIRFKNKNFPAWSEVSFNEAFESFKYGVNAPAKIYDGENRYLRITDIDDESRELVSDDITSPNFYLSDIYLAKEGDIFFARTGATVGKTYLYKKADGKLYYAGYLICGHVSNKFDRNFIFQLTLTHYYNKWVKITSTRTGQPGINSEEYKSFKFNCPVLEEQQQIGKFLSLFDNLIKKYRIKISCLEKIKKSLLQQMFI